MPAPASFESREPRPNSSGQESVAGIFAGLDAIGRASDFFASRPAQPARTGELGGIAHVVFEGPAGGGQPIKIGFFAGIHGDEPAGAMALVELARVLARQPGLAEGYQLHLFPVCNPSGFAAGTRCSASGKDLNREFWKNSSEPEVVFLEQHIARHGFHGLVSLHADDTSDGVYGFVRGAVLARSLLEPTLAASERILPRNRHARIDGFPARDGIISECYEGILASPPKLENTPFEIIFETPQGAPLQNQVDVCVAASLTILAEYRKFISFAADL